MNDPFHFYTRCNLVRLLNLKAKNTTELLEGIKSVPISCIYYHTHRFIQQHHYLSPEPSNDFAYWIKNILNLKELGEAFDSLDVVTFRNLEDLRVEFVRLLTEYNNRSKNNYLCPDGLEFHFMSCVIVILPTEHSAKDLKEFKETIGKITNNSLYFHMFEARLRLNRDENDFSAWFNGIGYPELAKAIDRLDPYTITLDGLRRKILGLVSKYA